MNKEEALRLLQATRLMMLGKDNQPISDLYYALDMAIEAVEALEEPKEAEWEQIENDDHGIDFRCSACHRYRFHNGEMIKKYRFCPNCGARMR